MGIIAKVLKSGGESGKLKRSLLGLGIFGIILIFFGTVFAFQGNGNIGGSSMTGDPFWIYAGAAIAILGVVIAFLGFGLGIRASKKEQKSASEKPLSNNGAPASSTGSTQ